MHTRTLFIVFAAVALLMLMASPQLSAGGFEPFPVTPPPLTIGPARPTSTPTPPPVYFPLIENGA